MLPKLGVWAGIVVFPFLCLYAIEAGAETIQKQLATAARAALRQDRFSGVTVSTDGRTLRLRGRANSESDRTEAQRLVAAIEGVRDVDNGLELQNDVPSLQTSVNQILTRKIEFEPGESTILPASLPVMEALRDALSRAPASLIQVDGYTDNSGDAEKNRVLSQLRAQAVVKWLADHGIARGRMKAAGHGSDRPIDSNDSAPGRTRNRRIELTVSER